MQEYFIRSMGVLQMDQIFNYYSTIFPKIGLIALLMIHNISILINLKRNPKMSNTPSLYQTFNSDRLNPEFIGIAEKYSRHKKYRVETDQKKKDVESNFNYLHKVNDELDKNLDEKKKELLRLKKIRSRYNSDVKQKVEEERKRKEREQELQRRSADERNKLKTAIKKAQQVIKNDRENKKIKLKYQLQELQSQVREKRQLQFTQTCIRHKSIELQKQNGNEKINQYHKKKNKQSLQHYISMIKNEDVKTEKNQQIIDKMNLTIRKWKKDIDTKQNKMKDIMDQIGHYSVQSTHERKANILAKGLLYRSIETSYSQRSKPADILKMSFNSEKLNELQA